VEPGEPRNGLEMAKLRRNEAERNVVTVAVAIQTRKGLRTVVEGELDASTLAAEVPAPRMMATLVASIARGLALQAEAGDAHALRRLRDLYELSNDGGKHTAAMARVSVVVSKHVPSLRRAGSEPEALACLEAMLYDAAEAGGAPELADVASDPTRLRAAYRVVLSKTAVSARRNLRPDAVTAKLLCAAGLFPQDRAADIALDLREWRRQAGLRLHKQINVRS